MTDQVSPEGGATPSISSANASPPPAEPAKGSEAASQPAATDPGEKKQPEDGRDLRIKELTRRLREEQRRNTRLMNSYEQATAQRPQPQREQQPSQPAQRKSFKDFNYDPAAYEAYLLSEVTSKVKPPDANELAEQVRQQLAAQERRTKFEQRAAKFAEATEDYDDVVNGAWDCSQPMAEAIEDSDEGPAIAYYLAQNPEIASQLAKLSPVRAGREIDRIEQKLIAERKKASEKAVSKAPPPPPKIEGSDPGNIEKDPSKMTDAQFRKWRESAMARRR